MPATRKRKEQSKDQSSLFLGIKPYAAKKGEKYMNKKQQEHFHGKLLAWRRELEDEITRTVHQMRDEPDNPPDPNDRASQETDMSLELRSRDRERKLIKKIDESLARMETGDYGYCDVCGVEIGLDRLEARPTAELCIDCKTLDEIREKKMG
ncbi:MAG: RNA polymerase-binding protein DksA [Candidatus Muproteobacteria bacterium RIFCSPHIGHO2_01_FULL_65_16]|uniref:RNA polymerase-binding transcription factor DksA n=2 Tax=Candidatus Muproteobacteria TaxID=1817795 RepID=A0A1F6TLU4_9PROT|nr:MAG: RNA polymerase-binding protein DksA [Candidatus Muproteobacteria bacterium RIFCSPHIGHO2_01_FULL_65_16]OGI48478.1 MAG: RNA polymerase-binding protein DksA [Candidatus Muproteobacteria bacterium RIFCSPHIGHO2_02_FULL_65_16]